MATISVVGTGYVGLVTGACLANLGNRVFCIDSDDAKIAGLRQGRMPIYEPGLAQLVERNAQAGRLRFTTSYDEGLDDAEFVFVGVSTPSGSSGEADTTYVEAAVTSVARGLTRPAIVVNKSTVPVGTGERVAEILSRNVREGCTFSVASNPEFLREGSAVRDFLEPDRVVVGAADPNVAELVASLYRPLGCPIVITDLRTAEMIKYAANAFLATKISFINEIAAICERLGADVKEVARGLGYDRRIGPHFLEAGVGYGGSCLPKDVRALIHMATDGGARPRLLQAVTEVNQDARRGVIQRLRALLGSLNGLEIGVLGLAFKPNTDDLREAPALEIIRLLQSEGAIVRAYDPVAMEKARRVLPEVDYCPDPYAVVAGSHGLVMLTDWGEFRQLDLERVRDLMAVPLVVDGRNLFEPAEMARHGFVYLGVGRGTVSVCPPAARPPVASSAFVAASANGHGLAGSISLSVGLPAVPRAHAGGNGSGNGSE